MSILQGNNMDLLSVTNFPRSLVLMALIFSVPFTPNAKTLPVNAIEVEIVRVIDGDTVILDRMISGTDRLRLEGMDTPETRRAKCKEEARLGYEAKGYARAFLEGKLATLYSSGRTDKYHRLLGRLVLDNQNYS